MNETPPSIGTNGCGSACVSTSSAVALNRECFCLGVDKRALHKQPEYVLAAQGQPGSLADSRPHLLSALRLFVFAPIHRTVARVATAIEEVVASYRAAVLAWAPEIARSDPGSPDGLLGLEEA